MNFDVATKKAQKAQNRKLTEVEAFFLVPCVPFCG
jgi:hypothetical protein